MRILDVLSTLSALGGLPSLVDTVKKGARYAITWLRRPQRRVPACDPDGAPAEPAHATRGRTADPGGIEVAASYPWATGDAPNTIIGTDQYVSGDTPQGTRRALC
jgi:hypothetical protein